VLVSGAVTEFPITTTAANLGGMIIGPDDSIWFAEWSGRGGPLPLTRIGRVSRSGGSFQEFPVPPSDNEFYDRIPHRLVVGPDGNIWFTAGSDALGRITMAGEITLYILPPAECSINPVLGPSPFGLTVGPDGALWLAAGLGHAVLRFGIATKQFEKLSVVLCGSWNGPTILPVLSMRRSAPATGGPVGP
jgi:virginiamycin B lyase